METLNILWTCGPVDAARPGLWVQAPGRPSGHFHVLPLCSIQHDLSHIYALPPSVSSEAHPAHRPHWQTPREQVIAPHPLVSDKPLTAAARRTAPRPACLTLPTPQPRFIAPNPPNPTPPPPPPPSNSPIHLPSSTVWLSSPTHNPCAAFLSPTRRAPPLPSYWGMPICLNPSESIEAHPVQPSPGLSAAQPQDSSFPDLHQDFTTTTSFPD